MNIASPHDHNDSISWLRRTLLADLGTYNRVLQTAFTNPRGRGQLSQWPAKVLIPLGFALLFAQAISELIKRIAVMRGLIPDPHATQVHAALEAEVEHVIEAMRKD